MASIPDLDLSHITINPKGQTPAYPVDTKGTNELFGDDSNPDLQSDREAQKADKKKPVEDGTRQLELVQTIKKKEETPIVQQQFLFIFIQLILLLVLM